MNFFLERIALNIFHNDVVVVARDAHVVNADDVGMRQARRRFCLAMKTFDKLHVGTIRLVENFYCDGSGKKSVVGFVDFSHAAAADFFFELITPAQNSLNHFFGSLSQCVVCNATGAINRAAQRIIKIQRAIKNFAEHG